MYMLLSLPCCVSLHMSLIILRKGAGTIVPHLLIHSSEYIVSPGTGIRSLQLCGADFQDLFLHLLRGKLLDPIDLLLGSKMKCFSEKDSVMVFLLF